jgi:hypothetical protein
MKLQRPTRISLEVKEPSTEQVVFNTPLPVNQEASEPTPEIPTLQVIKAPTARPGIPALQQITRTKNVVTLQAPTKEVVELLPPQSSVESEAEANSVVNTDDGRDEELQHAEELQEALGREITNRPVLERVQRQRVVDLPAPVDNESNDSDNPLDIEEPDRGIPPLQPVERSDVLVPALVVVRDGAATPEGINEIPKLDVYNKMEVVHLLLGRSHEDEEVVLLQSYSERTLHNKKLEEITEMLLQRVQRHRNTLANSHAYNLMERASHQTIRTIALNPVQNQRGLEYAWGLFDNGICSSEDLQAYAADQDVSVSVARRELPNADPHSVFSWALVKVKIGQDFGSIKLSSLMPTL